MLKLLFAAALAFAAPGEPPKSLTPAEQAQLEQNLRRGELIHRYDQAAWHTSDSMVERVPEAQRSQVRGWVVTPAERGDRSTYFGIQDGKPFLVYSAVWDGSTITGETIPTAGELRSLTSEELRLAQAVLMALPVAAKLGRCSESPFNVVVLPGSSRTDPISVYFLTPQTEEGLYPFGGHYKIDVQDGAVVSQRAFTKTCISLSTKGVDSENVAMLAITHSLDSIPTEIHVFGMFATSLPVMAIVPDGRSFTLWAKQGWAQVRIENAD